MEREQRYVVLKIKDIEAAGLFPYHINAFNEVCDAVSRARISKGKGLLECVVVEKDWPEYEPTWAAIANRVDKKDVPLHEIFAGIRERFSHDTEEATITREEFASIMFGFAAWSIERAKMPPL